MLQPTDRIYVAGHRGLVGSALVRALERRGFAHIIVRTREDLDLLDQAAVSAFLAEEKPDLVLFAAARVGGIGANMHRPAQFIYENLMAETNVIHGAYAAGVRRLLFLGSSCIYPRLAPQPIREDALLTGALEPTNAPYAISKIAGIMLCESYNRQYGTRYRSVMPTNLYGPGDRFDLEEGHVLPTLIRRFHEAKVARKPRVTLWGTGTSRRECLYVDDMAEACLHVLMHDDGTDNINIGSGADITIRELAALIAGVIGYEGEILFDHCHPDGTPRKLLDTSKLRRLGWQPSVSLEEGVRRTYDWYRAHVEQHAATVGVGDRAGAQ